MDYHIALKHELKVNSIDETILNEIQKHPKIAAVIGKKLGKMKKTFCKICEKYVYDKPAHNKEHHKGKVKCPKCDEEFSSYKEGWFAFLQKDERVYVQIFGHFCKRFQFSILIV